MGTNSVKHESSLSKPSNQLLSVQINDQVFAINIMNILEIRGWIPSTRLAHAPYYVKGMINLRGTVLAIIDLAERLGMPTHEPDASAVVVVVESRNRTVGLLVDAVCDIITITDDMRRAAPDTGSAETKEFVESLIMMDDRIITIVSLPAVVPAESFGTPNYEPA